MTRETSSTQRDWLKVQTLAAHQRVDKAFSGFDLSAPSGRAAFLRAQSAGLRSALEAFLDSDETLWADITARRIAATGHTEGRTADLRRLDPLGISYVVAGSLHGTSVLRGQLIRAGVRPVPAFFDGSDWKPMWVDVVSRINASPASRRAALSDAANATFTAFYLAAAAQKVTA